MIAVVTDRASGIGASMSALLAERGARVAVPDHAVSGVPAGYFGVACDATGTLQVDSAVAAEGSNFGAPDTAINNVGMPKRAPSSASDGAVSALTLAMAADHVGNGITVKNVTPRIADTPWAGRVLNAAAPAPRARQPMGRLLSGEGLHCTSRTRLGHRCRRRQWDERTYAPPA